MQQLTKAEEQLMEQLWKEKAFMKDLPDFFQTKPKRQRLPLY
jgi:predicted transcriptional regulator